MLDQAEDESKFRILEKERWDSNLVVTKYFTHIDQWLQTVQLIIPGGGGGQGGDEFGESVFGLVIG